MLTRAERLTVRVCGCFAWSLLATVSYSDD
jgi:hypothetical protein